MVEYSVKKLNISEFQERDNTGSREKGSKAEKDEHGQENASPLPQSGWKTNHHLGPPIPLDLNTIELRCTSVFILLNCIRGSTAHITSHF